MNVYKYVGYSGWWVALGLAGYAGYVLNFWLFGIALVLGLTAQTLIRKENGRRRDEANTETIK